MMKKSFLRSTAIGIFLTFLFQILSCSAIQPTKSEPVIAPVDKCQKPAIEPLNSKADEFFREKRNKLIVAVEKFERNCRLWKDGNIQNYDITVSAFQGGLYMPAQSVLIKVRDSKGTLIEPEPKVVEQRLWPYEGLHSIDEMFEAISKGIDEDAWVEVKYDEKFGYPKEWSVDNMKSSHSWKKLVIEKFEIIK